MHDLIPGLDRNWKRMRVRCRECDGRGWIEMLDETKPRICAVEEASREHTVTVRVGRGTCIRCRGAGRMQPIIPDRIEIKRVERRDDKKVEVVVGTVPTPALRLVPTMMTTMRPGDYLEHVNEKGELYYLAANNLGMGDIAALKGFARVGDPVPDRSKYADHLAMCKQRATEYLMRKDLHGAIASFTSDMNKNDYTAEFNPHREIMQLVLAGMIKTPEDFKDYLENFNV